MGGSSLGDASKTWRESLLKEVHIPDLLHSLPIIKYYNLARQLEHQANEADAENRFAHAYILYKRWLGLAIEVIPKHNYYKNHEATEREHIRLSRRLMLDKLSLLVERMDEVAKKYADELKVQEEERRRAEQLRIARERAAVEEERRRAEEARAAMLAAAAASATLRDTQLIDDDDDDALTTPLELLNARKDVPAPAHPPSGHPAAPPSSGEALPAGSSSRPVPGAPAPTNTVDLMAAFSALEVKPRLEPPSSAPGSAYPQVGRPSYMPTGPAMGDRADHQQLHFPTRPLVTDTLPARRNHDSGPVHGHDLAQSDDNRGAAKDVHASVDTSAAHASELDKPAPSSSERVPRAEILPNPTLSTARFPGSVPPPSSSSPAPTWSSHSSAATAPHAMGTGDAPPVHRSEPIAPAAPSAVYPGSRPDAPASPAFNAGNHAMDGAGSDPHAPVQPPQFPQPGSERIPMTTREQDRQYPAQRPTPAPAPAPAPSPVHFPSAPPPPQPQPFPTTRELPTPTAPPAYDDVAPTFPTPIRKPYKSASQAKFEINKDWDRLLTQNQAKIDYLATFQGRRPGPNTDSTNGCTVISPLVAYRHVTWHKPRLPNSHIEHVIDTDCPPILAAIRRKLSLANGSFIVPADVHDYLFDKGLLKNLFGDVHGGNVFNDGHMDELVKTLEKLDQGRKAGVAFFFCEHVIPILKNGDGTYELVDSLPHQPVGRAVRILCSSSSVLRVCLTWYCYSKLSPSKLQYIDSNPWNDAVAELDPRTFQAHVWYRS